MTPYVLALNPSVSNISFIDEVERSRSDFSMESPVPEMFATLPDGKVYYTVVTYSKQEENRQTVTKLYRVFFIQSNDLTGTEPALPKVTVVLPLKKKDDGEQLEVFRFGAKMPHLFISLPLLGTETWGVNYLFHSPLFTSDKDSRDSLRLVGNGQNNDNDALVNQQVIGLGNKLICQFIDDRVSTLSNAKYLVQDAFKTDQGDAELGKYLKGQQTFWREKFEALTIVTTDKETIRVEKCHVLDSILLEACLKDSKLLDALYSLIAKAKKWSVPQKNDLLYWSETINRWYKDEDVNPHSITLDDLAESVPSLSIEQKDLDWLLPFCEYVAVTKDALLGTHAMIPNENLILKLKTDILKPEAFDDVVKNVLTKMVPDKVECFALREPAAVREAGR